MPHAMVLLVKTYVFQHAMFASQVRSTALLHPSPCGESDLQSEILSIFRRLLALRGSVARASLMNELGVPPLQLHWLKACVTLGQHVLVSIAVRFFIVHAQSNPWLR
jgi:hypothetical protein